MIVQLVTYAYLIAAVFFIFACRALSSHKTAAKGNMLGIFGMMIAIGATFFLPNVHAYILPIAGVAIGAAIGLFMAKVAKMTSLPQMVALFNGLVGLAAVLLGIGTILEPVQQGFTEILGGVIKAEVALSTLIGGITFTGSMVAFAKLHGIIKKTWRIPGLLFVNLLLALSMLTLTVLFTVFPTCLPIFIALAACSLVLGFTGVILIGGADMPVVISLLNCYSGWAAAGVGFMFGNALMIIAGALVGASGAILSFIMCQAMNRSLSNVLLGGKLGSGASSQDYSDKTFHPTSADDVAFLMGSAETIIIVPGYGMAAAGAQHAVKDLYNKLKDEGKSVKFAIHPVAGRMPGHMNVLLAEANIPYDDVYELDKINNDFATCDLVYVIGANDVTNPLAKTDPTSPIYGMPILDVENARTVIFVKRSMAQGYSGVDNPLFYADNTKMLFGDARDVTDAVVNALK